MGLIPGSGRSPGGENGNPLQYSCLENPMDRGAWLTIVHGVIKSETRLSVHMCTHTHTHTQMYICIYQGGIAPLWWRYKNCDINKQKVG